MDKYDFESGDIILFEHLNEKRSWKDYLFNFIDGIIRTATKSKYNHVGMIIKNPPWNKELTGLFFLESNMEPIPDSEDNKLKFGVQLIPLDYVLKTKKKENNLYYRKLNCVRDKSFQEKLIKIHNEIHNKPYDTNMVDWVHAVLDLSKQKKIPKTQNVHKTKEFWCSALVSYVYCNLGFVDKNIPWTIIAPSQLGCEKKHFNLKFINCTIDKEIKL
tara:strand:- start:252 stop:899 length:648 start_codon:yes stop_codon:yes gene_type:complete